MRAIDQIRLANPELCHQLPCDPMPFFSRLPVPEDNFKLTQSLDCIQVNARLANLEEPMSFFD
jgi:hypothetical protein